jgi:hypothetical protein
MNVKRRVALVISVVMLFACGFPKIQEAKRSANPDGSVDAVIAERLVDATVSTPFEVYLVPHNAGVSGEPIFRADKVKSLDIFWINNKLTVKAEEARIFLQKTSKTIKTPTGIRFIEIEVQISKQSE